MDILSHGLWGGIVFGRKSRPSFWLAFVIGLAPDLLSFGILWAAVILGLANSPDFSHGTPPESTIPQYVHHLYNITHSFVVFLVVFALSWIVTKRPRWEVAAWGLHVLVDVPTHSHAFFATPVLWPIKNGRPYRTQTLDGGPPCPPPQRLPLRLPPPSELPHIPILRVMTVLRSKPRHT